MNLLAIDTSTERASVTLSIGEFLRHEEQAAQRFHAQLLLPMIDKLLAEAEMSLKQLDAIVYGRGPGSFTGLRIACSIAKGLGYANDLPLFPVSSLAAIAYSAFKDNNDLPLGAEVLATLDARMGQIYWACFDSEINKTLEQVSNPSTISLSGNNPLVLAGVGFEPYFEEFPSATQEQVIKQVVCYPHTDSMIRLVKEGKIKAVSAEEALPVYIRNQITQGDSRG